MDVGPLAQGVAKAVSGRKRGEDRRLGWENTRNDKRDVKELRIRKPRLPVGYFRSLVLDQGSRDICDCLETPLIVMNDRVLLAPSG